MVSIPGVHIQCLHPPMKYSLVQLERACEVAWMMRRGRLLLLETPVALLTDEAEQERHD